LELVVKLTTFDSGVTTPVLIATQDTLQ